MTRIREEEEVSSVTLNATAPVYHYTYTMIVTRAGLIVTEM